MEEIRAIESRKTVELGWKGAIKKVLSDADRPLNSREITQLIGDRGLRSLTGSTPLNTVGGRLSSMVKHGDEDYGGRILRAGRGFYKFVTSDDTSDYNAPLVEDSILDDEEQDHDPNHIVMVPAYGLYWEKEKIKWGSGEILGRLATSTTVFNFAEQKGVYLLHNGSSVAYVGRTKNSLHERLRTHNKERDHKSMRWDRFSWFGFCGVDEKSGELRSMPDQVDSAHLISILEAVLIEALEPPVNGRRGDYLGLSTSKSRTPRLQRNKAVLSSKISQVSPNRGTQDRRWHFPSIHNPQFPRSLGTPLPFG